MFRRRFAAHLDEVVDREVGERVGVLFSPGKLLAISPEPHQGNFMHRKRFTMRGMC
jgi:hypothetical protein